MRNIFSLMLGGMLIGAASIPIEQACGGLTASTRQCIYIAVLMFLGAGRILYAEFTRKEL